MRWVLKTAFGRPPVLLLSTQQGRKNESLAYPEVKKMTASLSGQRDASPSPVLMTCT